MNEGMKTLLGIMFFYSLLTFFLFPFIAYHFYKMNGIMYGMIVGAVVSIVLWDTYGKKMVRI